MEKIQDRFTLIWCSQKIQDKITKHTKNKVSETIDINEWLTPLQIDFHTIQHELNALNVKWKLIRLWVDREILDKIIPQYEKAVHSIIYPLIVEKWITNKN